MKVFISQPMSGRSEEDIINERIQTIGKIRMYLGDDVTILDSYVPEDTRNIMRRGNHYQRNGLWADGMEYVFWLGTSITTMAKADVVWFVNGWHESSGCIHEWHIACHSDARIIMEDESGKIIDSAKENE